MRAPPASKLRTRMQSTPNRSEKRKVIPGLDLHRGRLAHGRTNRSEQVTDILSFAEDHLEQIGANVGRFTGEVNELGRLVAVADAPENAVHRGAARMEICLERLLDDFDEVRRANYGHGDSEGARLLAKLYRDTLAQIQDWLDETVECLNDPTGALKKRGLVLEEGKRVPITLDLEFEAPPSMNDLVQWTVQRGDTLIDEERAKSDKASGGTVWMGLLALFGLGWWLGSAGEDGDCDW